MEKDNKLIAEFMELPTKVFKSGELNYYFREFNSGSWYEEHELSYNVSWDWLVPALKKAQQEMSVSRAGLWRMITNPIDHNIEDVHNLLVEFIKDQNN